MPKINVLEPIVEEVLIINPISRKDDFVLLSEVLKRIIDTDLSLKYIFLNHDKLGVPSFESITRCRRKIQERNHELKSKSIEKIREAEAKAFVDYALGDKQTF